MKVPATTLTKKSTALKLFLPFFLVTLAISLTSCGKNTAGQLIVKGQSSLMKLYIGRTYTLTYVNNAPQWDGSVTAGDQTLTLTSESEISGTFICTYNGSILTANYGAQVQWGTDNAVSITNIGIQPTECSGQLNKYFTFQPEMLYTPPDAGGSITLNTPSGLRAVFSPWN